jgi:hypothetical protein
LFAGFEVITAVVVINIPVKFELFTAVTMKNAVFWDVTPCTSCVNLGFGGTYHLHLQGRKSASEEQA